MVTKGRSSETLVGEGIDARPRLSANVERRPGGPRNELSPASI